VRQVIGVLVAALALAGCGGEAEEGDKLRLALDFIPNAVHAPVYAAADEGAVELLKPGPSPDSLKLVLNGRADVGLLDIHDFGLALERKRPVVAVAALVQKPLAALAAQPEIQRPADLEGRRVGVSGLPSDPAFVRAVMEADGGDFSKVRLITIGFSAVPQLLQGNVAAVPVFWNAEGVALQQRGWDGHLFKVDDYGAPAYPEVLLFTTRDTLRERPVPIDDLVSKIEEGIRTVRSDPDAIAEQIAEAGNAPVDLVRAQLDAVSPLFGTILQREPIEEWARFDLRHGIVKRPLDLDNAFRF
jgi:NitT/TauT family transport system substrate-binding protein/putative hydroxymethylpyrimidine transport system substrate-binding protein